MTNYPESHDGDSLPESYAPGAASPALLPDPMAGYPAPYQAPQPGVAQYQQGYAPEQYQQGYAPEQYQQAQGAGYVDPHAHPQPASGYDPAQYQAPAAPGYPGQVAQPGYGYDAAQQPGGYGTAPDPYAAYAAQQAPPQQHQQPQGGSIRVSVAVVEPHPHYRDRMIALLGGGGTPFNSLDELGGRLTGAVPVVVIMGPSSANTTELEKAERLIRSHPALGAILVTEELTTNLLQQALRAGVRDVLTINGEATQLPGAVQRVAVSLDSHSTRRHVDTADPVHSDNSAGPLGEIITVFSTKGGAGKSVVACNLAIALAQRTGEAVCLVDADLQFGDVAVMLKLAPHHTIVDAVASIDRLDAALLESLLVTHEQSGVRVLPAPLEPAFADQVGAGEMVAIVEKLRTLAKYVVVDTPAYFNDVVLGLVEISDTVALIAGMDIPNIKNVKIGLQTLRLLNTPQEKLMLVLNRSNSKVKLDIGEVERTLQVKADALVPSDVLIPQSVNKGVPVVLHSPKSPVAKSIYTLADLVIDRSNQRHKAQG